MKARVSPVQSNEPRRIMSTHSGLEPGTSGSTVQSSKHYTTAALGSNLTIHAVRCEVRTASHSVNRKGSMRN